MNKTTPRNSLQDIHHHNIFSYWLKQANPIKSVDRRSDRDRVKMLKSRVFKSLQTYKQ